MTEAAYEAKYGKGPHLTVDAVVQNGNREILLVKRRDNGLWALPGGFLDPEETIVEAATRETMEEAGIDLHNAAVGRREVFDAIDRDPRSRIVTTAVHFVRVDLPTPVAGDDAADAAFFPPEHVAELDASGLIYADHAEIIAALTQDA